MITFLASIAVLIAASYIITIVPWPDIDPGMLQSISTTINYIWSFNLYIPIDTFFRLAMITFGIIIALQIIRLAGRVYEAITGNRAPTS